MVFEMGFAESYLGQLRASVGSRPLLAIGARVLIEDQCERFLIIRRTDSGLWGLPGGAMELAESLLDVAYREALEEANAQLKNVTAFGISSQPSVETHIYPNGDQVQNISLLAHGYIANEDYAPDTDEASEVKFVRFEDIDQGSFVANGYPTFLRWNTFKATGVFQVD